jgi:flavin reductase (DIM6/NTAB) family NADH-FMN oxidoreductase RutF
MIVDPKEQTFNENYKLLIGSILPRPIAFVSTVSKDGEINLAPYSFFTGITSNPPTICFSPARKGKEAIKKDTLNNIEATGEFVINVVTEGIVKQMNETATEFPPQINEFEKAGLTPVASLKVMPPRVEESPINMECRMYQTIYIGEETQGAGALVIGEIVLFHISENIFENGKINTELLKPVGRLAGNEYTTIGKRFSLSRNPYNP